MAGNPSSIDDDIEDVFGDKELANSSTHSDDDYYGYYYSTEFYVTIVDVILKCAVYLVAMAINGILIYVFCKFKALRTRLNSYILSYTVLNTMSFGCVPLFLIIHLVVEFLGLDFNASWCLANGMQTTCLVLCFVTDLMLVLDYTLVKFDVSLVRKRAFVYEHAKEIVYVTGLAQFVVTNAFCFAGGVSLHSYNAAASKWAYVIVLCCILTLDAVNKCQPSVGLDKNRHALVVGNVIVLFFLPQYVHDSIYRFLVWDWYVYSLMMYTAFIPQYMVLGHQIAVIVALGMTNKNFKIAFYKTFKKRTRDYDEEFEETSEDGSVADVAADQRVDDTAIVETATVY